ncbi:LamG-like jellyroll fold domain-containing protein [Aureispira sp. CCB-QB1]|uniref:LamG-like jellyroll fold domain-containing protein n=1 Tax=Aureispira sp. CCB-QB1 TaxID=1313421 RepID=UPI0006971DFC|nr:LamG-like jellyroll fold domain-containing protein [Aureispira sp. CCB-QB1]
MTHSNYTKWVFLCFYFCFYYSSNAQTLDWVGSIANPLHNVQPNAIIEDKATNIYVVGRFRETADFDMDAGVTNLSSASNYDGFVAKYDLNGALIWAMNLGATTTSFSEDTRVYDVAVDGADNIIIVGQYRGVNVNFAPRGGNAVSLTSNNTGSFSDAFVAKYNASGQCIWVMGMGSTSSSDEFLGVDVDAANNIYVTGRLDDNLGGGININSLGTAHFLNTSNNSSDAVLIKYDANGIHQWDLSIGGTDTDYGHDVKVDGSIVYVGGRFRNAITDFNPLGTPIQRTPVGGYDAFLAQYNTSNGLCNWVVDFGSTGTERVEELEIDSDGNVYITGAFQNTVDLDPIGGSNSISAQGGNDIFVSKYNSSGVNVWGFGIGGANSDEGLDISIDGSNLYLTGYFENAMDFDPSPNTATITAQGGATSDEAFLAKYTTGGAYLNAFAIEGADNDRAYGIDANNNRIYLTGYFGGNNVDFDPNGTATLSAASASPNHDGFVVAYSDVPPAGPEVAIVEWLANPSGIDAEEEWVEIYNYGSAAVNLRGWRLKDEDTDNALISATDLFLPAGASLILARDKSEFEQHWMKGCANNQVVEVAMILNNGNDEIVLEDDLGTVVWSVAYQNDEIEGRATHYTEVTYTTSVFGSKASPGVNRSGNDVSGTLGYERNDATADANAFANDIGDIGSPLFESRIDENRGNSVLLDGANDYIDLGATTALENQSGFTFETWIKPITIDVNSERIFSKRLNNTSRIEIFLGNGGTEATNQFIKISICNGTSQTANAPNLSVPVGEWTHIAVTFDGTASAGNRLKFYANGIRQSLSSDPVATTTPSGTGNAHIGKRSDNNNKPSNIELDEIRLWNLARTEQLIRENMHLTLSGCETGLVSYYQLNETSGTATEDVVGNNPATLVNGAARISSGVNTGNSNPSNSQTIAAIATTGVQSFSNAHLDIDFTAKTGAEDITVTYQNYTPNTISGATATTIYNNPTWTINSSSTTGTSTGNFTFTFPSGTFNSLDPLKYRLYHRAMNADGAWQEIAIASALTNTTVTFLNIEVLGQFMVVQESADGISPVRGNMYAFDGVDDYIDFGNLARFNMTNNITLEAWVKMTTTSGDQKIITKFGDVGGDDAYALQAINGEPQFLLNFGPTWVTVAAGMTMTANEWYHIVGVYDGTAMRIYVNGIEQNSIVQSGTFDVSASTFKIGGWAGVGHWNGCIDEVRVWNAARTLSDIRENMHLTLKGTEANLVAYYQFNTDDPTGTANGVKDALGTAHGVTVNMTNTAYQASEVAVAGGISQTLTIPNIGPFTANYSSVGMGIEFGATTPDGDVVVSRLETESPHGANTIGGQADDEYFVIRNYGSNTTFTTLTSLSLLNVGYIDPSDAAQPEASSPLGVYKRASNDYGASWGSALANANTATSGHNGSVVFDNSAGITSFSQVVFANANGGLPVELIEFKATRQNVDEVLLNWATATEINNQGFQIERMLEGESSFSEIGWVNGKGNSVVTNHYQYIDENSSLETSYYRLKQMDFDGTISYSDIRAVNGQSSGKYIDWKIYPNPVGQELHLTFKQLPKQVSNAMFSILNMEGKRLYEQKHSIQTNQTIVLDCVRTLPSGTYTFVLTTDDDEISTYKFVKE